MSRIIFFVILIGGAYFLYRRFVSDAEKLQARSKAAEKERQTGATGTLVKDEETGEYRLRREEE
jgi:membrane protein implicated in regulation of membrane protease activity